MITLRKFIQVLGMLSLIALFAAWQQGNFPNISGAGSSTSVGPVINVTNPTFGASQSLADNAVPFAAVAAAANTAAYVSVGVPTIRSTAKTVMSVGTVSSQTITVNISAGDTVLVGVIAYFP